MDSSAQEHLDVVIVGGSLAGIFTAITLKSSPNVKSITILERYHEQDLQDGGAGLRNGNEVIKFLSHYTGAQSEEYTRVATTGRMILVDGSEAAKYPIDAHLTSWGQLFRISMRHLRDEGVKQGRVPCTYLFGCTVTSLNQLSDSDIAVTYTTSTSSTAVVLKANLVICADGSSSRLRSLFLPDIIRQYVGYVIYRGTVPMSEVSAEVQQTFDCAGVMVWGDDAMAVCYQVPDNSSTSRDGPKLLNWAFYHHLPKQDDLKDLMTDQAGVHHQFSLPRGKMRHEHVLSLQTLAKDRWSPQYAEIVEKTELPFVQVITDSPLPENTFCGGKVLFIGDVVGGQRPHIAAATTQCVYYAEMTRRLVDRQESTMDWREKTLRFSRFIFEESMKLGEICMESVNGDEGVKGKMRNYIKEQLRNLVQIDNFIESDMGKDFADGLNRR